MYLRSNDWSRMISDVNILFNIKSYTTGRTYELHWAVIDLTGLDIYLENIGMKATFSAFTSWGILIPQGYR